MCKNHDQQHYPVLIREIAGLLAGEDREYRDLFLQIFSYAGAEKILDLHSECMPMDVRVKCKSRLEAERTRLFKEANDSFDDIHDRWKAAIKEADEIPF